MKFTAFASYGQTSTLIAKSFTTVDGCQQWLDDHHGTARGFVRADCTSDGTRFVRGELNFGRVVAQREHDQWIRS